jgi:flagellar biosynthetic protein FliR
VAATVLLWARLGALFLLSPIVSAIKAPPVFFVLFTFVLAGLLAAAFGLRPAQQPVDQVLPFALSLCAEVLTGAVLGFAVQCAFSAFNIAGQLLDVQMGFGIGAIFNPVTGTNSPVVGTVLSLFAVAFFFAVDGQDALVRGIAFSVQSVPPGRWWFLSSVDDMLRPFGAMFTTAIAVIAPALFVLLLVEVGAMIASRALPQMNVFFVAIPAKILIGLVMLALSAPFIAPTMGRAYAGIFRFWDGVLR